jgi:glycine/D-amino acid oxidase-like deaminating enzyme
MIAVIGGGLTGLSAAIRLAGQGKQVTLFEAAAQPGGRTRSFSEPGAGQDCDNGPHLLTGACRATQRLLADCGAAANIHWQDSLALPLWDQSRGLFCFQPSNRLPFALALIVAASRLPGHSISSALAMMRLGRALQSERRDEAMTVADWIEQLRLPDALVHDLIEPICLGAMNEAPAGADAASFRLVLREAFASRGSARLGWFTQPMSEALIRPLVDKAVQSGVRMLYRRRIRSLLDSHGRALVDGQAFDAAVVATPAYATDRLLGRASHVETRMISNIHFWFDERISFPAPLVGGLGTLGHWFFDVSAQMRQGGSPHHICAVISGEARQPLPPALSERLCMEIAAICGVRHLPEASRIRIVREKRATVLVRPRSAGPALPSHIIDASERPLPGELPATIESAIRRGEKAASSFEGR